MMLFALAILLLLFSTWRAHHEFGSYFNPWFFFLCVELVILHLLPIFSANILGLIDNTSWFDDFLFCSYLYVGGYALAFFIKPRVLRDVVRKGMQVMPEVRVTTRTGILCYLFLGLALLFLIGLGSGGTLWFTNPRDAYLNFRGATGDGALFVLAQWALMLCAVVNLNATKDRKIAFVLTLLLHCLIGYFLGSKQILLNLIVFSLFVIDFQFHLIRLRHFIGMGSIAIFLFITLLGGTEDSTPLVFAGLYFSEYAVNTAKIFDPDVTSSFAIGDVFFSNFWAYMPRFLVDNKPYEYGAILINSILFPGAAERGQTPGLLYWSSWYVDFGFIGVLFYGLLRGVIDGAIFRTAKSLRDSPIKIALIFGASVTPIFLYAPIAYQYVFLFVASFSLKQLTGARARLKKYEKQRKDPINPMGDVQ